MNKKGLYPGIATGIRVIVGVFVLKIVMEILSTSPLPTSLVWSVSLGIVVGAGLLSYKFIPIL